MNSTELTSVINAGYLNTPLAKFYVVCDGCLGSPIYNIVKASLKLSRLRAEYPLLSFKLVVEVAGYVH